MRLLISVSREKLSDIAKPKYTNSWTAFNSKSAMLVDGGCSTSSLITYIFLRLMVSPKSSQAPAKRFMSYCRSFSGWVVTAASSAN